MTAIPLHESSLIALKDKVVVITGSARGIGAATVQLLHQHGALVTHGDWDAVGGSALDLAISSGTEEDEEKKKKPGGLGGGKVQFVQTDVTDYDSLLRLFDTAYNRYGRVDIAISNAGVVEMGGWFGEGIDLESVRTKPTTKTLDVNLTGVLCFSHIAAVYLKQNNNNNNSNTLTNTTPPPSKSLLLVSSIAGITPSPGLFAYGASKHGVIGLLRSLRDYLPKTHNVRVNAICPWMTDTYMTLGIRENWIAAGLPVNRAEDVARMIVEVVVDGEGVLGNGGKAVLVEGGRGWDVEEGIDGSIGSWMGELSRTFEKGQELLGDGRDWDKR